MKIVKLSAMAMLAALLCGAGEGPTAPRALGPAREARFPTFGLRVTPPAGATFTPPSQPGHIAYYELSPAGGEKPLSILIEAEPKVDKSASAAAEPFVKHGATVLRSIKVSGEEGVELAADMNAGGYTRRVSCIVVHDRREYVFSIFSKGGSDGAAVLEQMLASVDFRPPESPLEHLDENFDKPLNILDAFSVEAPAFLRPYVHAGEHLMLGAHDFVAGDSGFFVDFAVLKTPPRATFDNIHDSYAGQIRKNLKLANDLVWTTTASQPRLHISQPQSAAVPTPGGVMDLVVRYSLLELPDGRIVQVYFSIPDRGPSAVKAYLGLSDKMLASVRLPRTQASVGVDDGR